MTVSAEAVRNLLIAHVKGDEIAFRAAVAELISHERRVNRVTFANELERIMGGLHQPTNRRDSLNGANGHVGAPRDKDRDALLIETCEPRRSLEDLVLAPETRTGLKRIVSEWRQADVLRTHGVRPISKVLFWGPPGVGKSVAAEALAKELFLPLATVRFDAVVSSYLGETASNLRKVFEFARTRPMVLLFDEFDAIGRQRGAAEEHGELKRVVTSFLQLLDGFRSDTITIAATNHEGLLDPALWRRFDEVISFPLPVVSEIEAILCRLLRQTTVAKSVRLADVATRLLGVCHADVERVAVEAIKDTILSDSGRVEPETISAAIERLRSRPVHTEVPVEAPVRHPKARRRRKKAE